MSLRKSLALRMAKKYVCGSTIRDVVRGAQHANSRGMAVKVNFLGENVVEDSVAEANLQEYLALQKAISSSAIKGGISVKLTQLGFEVNEKAEERLERLVREASLLKQMVWVDMEHSRFLERTMAIHLRLLNRYRDDVGITIQAYLRRSEKDLQRLLSADSRVRLVKGAYSEQSDVAYVSKKEIRANFERLMELLFEKGSGFAIATHHPSIIERAKSMAGSKRGFEFETLKGIGDQLGLQLVRSGYRVSEYVPYGKQWYNYFLRRMKANPGRLWPILHRILWYSPS